MTIAAFQTNTPNDNSVTIHGQPFRLFRVHESFNPLFDLRVVIAKQWDGTNEGNKDYVVRVFRRYAVGDVILAAMPEGKADVSYSYPGLMAKRVLWVQPKPTRTMVHTFNYQSQLSTLGGGKYVVGYGQFDTYMADNFGSDDAAVSINFDENGLPTHWGRRTSAPAGDAQFKAVGFLIGVTNEATPRPVIAVAKTQSAGAVVEGMGTTSMRAVNPASWDRRRVSSGNLLGSSVGAANNQFATLLSCVFVAHIRDIGTNWPDGTNRYEQQSRSWNVAPDGKLEQIGSVGAVPITTFP